jgi:hypothetical protein
MVALPVSGLSELWKQVTARRVKGTGELKRKPSVGLLAALVRSSRFLASRGHRVASSPAVGMWRRNHSDAENLPGESARE